MTKRWRASKSDGPSLSARLKLSCTTTPCELSELKSVDFDSVYDALNCSPRESRWFAEIQSP